MRKNDKFKYHTLIISMLKMNIENCPRVLTGGTLYDGTGAPPIKDSIVILQDEYIIGVGKKSEIEIPAGAEVYDITGKTVLPGLIDSHCHFLWMGIDMNTKILLNDSTSLEEALQKIRQKVKEVKLGDWIIGVGWDESKWPENRFIYKEDLDRIAPNNPVMLSRVCGHLVSINTKAMEVANIIKETQATEGGQVDKDSNGENTGILRDCRYLIEPFIPSNNVETMVAALETASLESLRLGCTSVHDAGLTNSEISAYQLAEKQGKLKIRVSIMLKDEAIEAALKLGVQTGFGSDLVQIGPFKYIMDGSLGARTAALFEPYEDELSTIGLLLMEPEELTRQIVRAHRANIQTATHAIGDLAIEKTLDSIQEALRLNPRKDHRHRIEHCEITSSQQIERIKQLGIVPAMQPNFIGEWSGPDSMYRQRLGKKRERLNNQYRAMLDEDIPIAFGSDGMPFNPIYGIWSAVNHPIKGNRVSLEEAIMCYTLNSAFSGFHEDKTGSIEPGKLGDIAVFNGDLSETPPRDIKNIECYMTLVNGKILYHAEF
jgi:predicted amidohydrolase YtcJ